MAEALDALRPPAVRGPGAPVPPAPPYRPPPDQGLRIVHEHPAFVVLDKPAGLLSEPGRGADKHDSLLVRARARWPGARLVHRLDMSTSGLMVLALDAAAHAALGAAFRERRVAKGYEALVHGPWPVDLARRGEIDLPVAADWARRPLRIVCAHTGRAASTHYEARAPAAAGTWRVALEPVTGRTHQLRVHLAAIGLPIVGDPLYGRADDDAPRLMLHACALSFEPPGAHAYLHLASAVPF